MAPASDAPPTGPRPLARALAAALLSILGLIAAPSCTAALGLDGFTDAPASLCDKLQVCYGDASSPACQARVDSRLAESGGGEGAWLQQFSSNVCLESCAAARRCLDITPVCAGLGAACGATTDCCGFNGGDVDCVDGTCCKTAGVGCGDTDECCRNAGTCQDGVCGGTPCRGPRLGCSIDDQCCSKHCVDHTCSDAICNDDHFECAQDSDCCSGHCEANGVCGTSCVAEGGVCRPGQSCCGGLSCFTLPGADSGVCSPGACLPLGVDCVPGASCCDGLSCDPAYAKCAMACLDAGAACTVAGECCSGVCSQGVCEKQACSNAYCDVGSDCCSGTCLHGTCTPQCKPSATCEHDVCTEGSPLSKDACAATEAACVAEICATDGYCCCGAWDTFCVEQVATAAADPTSKCSGACL